ncbi:response regulator transcription factor [Bradyrhizobium paxllaeri]|uniref:response regulator transcription factor n=1 Tax=Bradyrhizobium paxllaeri TaxID=190148 RepID=UPI001AED2304|nr:response regulator [Bradyrhizobium paxllaeri]
MPNPPVIAVVDDDEGMRLALFELLQVLTLSCLTFDGPEAFLAAYVPGAFDCLITDIHMPGMSGLELQQHLRSLGSTIPVIVVTSSTDPASRSCALNDGAVAYLRKPVDDETLIRHLKVALGPDFIGS